MASRRRSAAAAAADASSDDEDAEVHVVTVAARRIPNDVLVTKMVGGYADRGKSRVYYALADGTTATAEEVAMAWGMSRWAARRRAPAASTDWPVAPRAALAAIAPASVEPLVHGMCLRRGAWRAMYAEAAPWEALAWRVLGEAVQLATLRAPASASTARAWFWAQARGPRRAAVAAVLRSLRDEPERDDADDDDRTASIGVLDELLERGAALRAGLAGVDVGWPGIAERDLHDMAFACGGRRLAAVLERVLASGLDGLPDVLVFSHAARRFLWLEAKGGADALSVAQQSWLRAAASAGFESAVLYVKTAT